MHSHYLCHMKNLWEAIYEFLEREGFECTCKDMRGCKVIYALTSWNQPRAVLPLEIYAESEEKAGAYADMASECIRNITDAVHSRPIIITEDRWNSQKEMMKARLLAHLEVFEQIYARNCEIKKIDKQTAADFLAANHSYGDASCRHRYGLYLKRHTGHNADGAPDRCMKGRVTPGTLVAVATFSNARRWIKGDKTIRSYEWTRYASLPGVRLSGGMGKLLNAFIEDVHPDDIMTYADLEWSEGKVYERLGFVLEGVKVPVTFAVDPESWDRSAVKEQDMTKERVFFRNFGSNKYRLKLTDYQ